MKYTDLSWLIIFILYMGCWMTVGIYTILTSDIRSMLAPIDSQGKKCGIDKETLDKPYLVFFDVTKCNENFCNTTKICRKKCPTENWVFEEHQSLDNIRKNIMCIEDVSDKSLIEIKKLIELNQCASWHVNSAPIVGRCYPKTTFNDILTSDDLNKVQTFFIDHFTVRERIIDKTISTKQSILIWIAGSAMMSFIFILLLRWFALPCIIISITSIIGVSLYLSIIFTKNYFKANSIYWIINAFLLAIFIVYISVKCRYSYQRIYLVSKILQEVSKANMTAAPILLFPFLIFSIQFTITAYTMEVGMGLGFIGTILIVFFYVIHIFGDIWIRGFIAGIQEMTLATIFSKWFWTVGKSDLSIFNISSSIIKTVRYHLGTAALGSILQIIIGLFKLIIQILELLSKTFEFFFKHPIFNEQHRQYFKKCVNFVNHNGYIFCAIHEQALWKSADNVYSLVQRNNSRVIILNGVVKMVLLAGRFFIVCTVTLLAYWNFISTNDDDYYWVPVLLVSVGSLSTSEIFLNVYITAIDTMFICFLENLEKDDKSEKDNLYMNSKITQLFSQKLDSSVQ